MIQDDVTSDLPWCLFTIYDRPEDFPEDVVVRATVIKGQADPENPVPLPFVWRFPTAMHAIRAIRAAKPEATRIPRDPSDPPAIVESWF